MTNINEVIVEELAVAEAAVEVAAEVVTEEKKTRKRTTRKAAEAVEGAEEKPAKKTRKTAKKAEDGEEGAEKPAKKTTRKKAAVIKANVSVQFAGKEYTTEQLIEIAKDVWQYDLGRDAADFKSVDLYVKSEESSVYYVINEEVSGSFAI